MNGLIKQLFIPNCPAAHLAKYMAEVILNILMVHDIKFIPYSYQLSDVNIFYQVISEISEDVYRATID